MSRSTRQPTEGFSLPARLLHWLMAAGIIAMLFIGVGMVASVSERHQWLIQIHKPLGLALLALACLRLARRLYGGAPALPADLPAWQRQAAHVSHVLLYALMFAMPLIGWAMVSAGGYPVMVGNWQLPSIAPANAALFAWLRGAHRYLAFALLATVLLHLAAALFHGWIRRDGVLHAMTRGH
ncbi:cytochrome b [Bordetella petrii]|uniref:YodB protein n=1 Tax=Bordetella petrii (strain ATCC BAA-461 / DSM 12804 / CCUG 43448 / CIP 107267 / Se-1111R) TaxID=340100 RepID=A9IHM5_BORPD|nr:cytochrome b/b6 domain-containing protein [Bordetella petrii]CAP45250.1 yodB [Bordetella petrii]